MGPAVWTASTDAPKKGRRRIRPCATPGVIDALDALERYARAFDEISRESDAHYSARSFVRWVRLETTSPSSSFADDKLSRNVRDEAALVR